MRETSGSPDPVDALVAECLRRRGPDGAMPIDEVCARHPELAAALRARLHDVHATGQGPEHSDPDQSHPVTGGGQHASIDERLRSLRERGASSSRYEVRGEVARGGMGVILRAFDQDLGRALAMKVIRTRGEDGEAVDDDRQVLERFVEEAQITGQLDHPGVVPVHELGLDAEGRAYFTMRLVRGRTADEVFALARERADGWTPTRAIEVMLKVCDTLAYAHSKGVVHRDLKPSNVMVGRYGEVYVMDWGLAKVLGRTDSHDLRLRPPESTLLSRVHTDRSKEHDSDPDSALRTMDGAIVGTPCYMPPEQANGQVEEIGVRSDVYAAGAMLYTLLTGVQPYLRPGSKTSPYMVLEWVRQGPPTPVPTIDPKAPPELVAICARAMARAPGDRYATMGELADDLRAWLEGRVVRAYRTGARAELWSWVRRNRGMATGLATAMLALVGGGIGALVYAQQAERERAFADTARTLAELERTAATEARTLAEAEQQKALEALAAAEAARELQEDAETKLRQETWSLKRNLMEAEKSARDAKDLAHRLRGSLDAATRQRAAERRVASESARCEPLDTVLAAGTGQPFTDTWDAAVTEVHRTLVRRAEAEGRDPLPLAPLVQATRHVLRREPAAAVPLLAEPLPDTPFEPVRSRLLAAALWQAGERHGALQSHLASLQADDPELRNARETLALVRDLCDTGAASELATIVQECTTRLGELGGSEGPLLHGSLHTAAAATRFPEVAGRALRQLGRIDEALAVLRQPATSPTLQALQRLETARCHLAVHRPHLALEALGEQATACVFLPMQRQHAELRAAALGMAGDLVGALRALDAARAALAPGASDHEQRLAAERAALQRLADGATGVAVASATDSGTHPLSALLADLQRIPADIPPATVVRHLRDAAVGLHRWLVDYARFDATPWTARQTELLRALAALAAARLADAAQADAPLDMGAVWSAVATFRDPLGAVAATRSGSLRHLGHPGSEHEAKRAAWLEERLRASASPGASEAPPNTARADVEAAEARLRAVAPALSAALLPSVPDLTAVRAALGPRTCLVEFVVSPRHVVAFVVAHEGCELVSIPPPPGWPDAATAGEREGHARSIVDALLQTRLLAQVARWQRLLVVADGALHDLPLEAAALAHEAMPEDGEIVRAPAGTAWFACTQRPPTPIAHGTAVLLGAEDPAEAAWWRETLAPDFAGARLVEFARDHAGDATGALTEATCLVLTLPRLPGGAAGLGRLQVPTAAELLPQAPDGLHLQSLRDLPTQARLCIVRCRGDAASPGEGAALASFVRGLWAAGCSTVVTLRADQPLAPCGPLVQAVVAAVGAGRDPSRAWHAAGAAARARGTPPTDLAGASLWVSR